MARPLDDVADAAERMRSAEETVAFARRELADAIRAAHAAGESLAAIGRAAGVSRQWVSYVVKDAAK